jgi:GNAT superfamily N-acetyltransferase
MKLAGWMRFTWDLEKLPDLAGEFGPHFNFRTARQDEKDVVWTVVQRAFALDSSWNDTYLSFREDLGLRITEAFGRPDNNCLVLTHGARIVGASALCADRDANNHLYSGPCILPEYRNRGFGSALLHKSLSTLRELGFACAHGLTREGGTAAKFVYTKFKSSAVPCEQREELVTVAAI